VSRRQLLSSGVSCSCCGRRPGALGHITWALTCCTCNACKQTQQQVRNVWDMCRQQQEQLQACCMTVAMHELQAGEGRDPP
jgi:hypothetical protein